MSRFMHPVTTAETICNSRAVSRRFSAVSFRCRNAYVTLAEHGPSPALFSRAIQYFPAITMRMLWITVCVDSSFNTIPRTPS